MQLWELGNESVTGCCSDLVSREPLQVSWAGGERRQSRIRLFPLPLTSATWVSAEEADILYYRSGGALTQNLKTVKGENHRTREVWARLLPHGHREGELL